ncbi:MAG TPA: hypothetical protein VGO46_14365 [Gemmatimonadaceae bacterium]|nr:hypothetical protein [Gemmatimonadaceae bacterium]
MTQIEDSLDWQYLSAAAHALVPLDEFESWVYASTSLERLLGSQLHLELVDFDFRDVKAQRDLSIFLRRALTERGRTSEERDVALWIARGYLAGRVDLATVARVLARIRVDSNEWVPSEFTYIDSELDEIPTPAQYDNWNPEALAKKLEESAPRLKAFEEGARLAAQKMLDALQSDAG